MKIRNGFVSNSSSSSFVVAFKTKPKNADEVKKILFGTQESISQFNYKFTANELAERIFNDIKSQKPNNIKQIKDNIDGYSEAHEILDKKYGESYKFNGLKMNIIWDIQEKLAKKIKNQKVKQFIEDNKDCFIYCFEYGDDNGSFECVLEHGNTFANLNHIIRSNH